MKKPFSRAALFSLAMLVLPVLSTACVTAPFVESWATSGTVEWIDGPGDCILNASVSAARPSAATVHYRRRSPQAPLRLSFVVDPHITSLTVGESASLASGVAESVPTAGPDKASLFDIFLVYGGGGVPRIVVSGACHQAAVPQGECGAVTPVTFADFPLRITVEVQIGAGSSGHIQMWLGDDVVGTPTVRLDDLDNERWQGIDRVSLGLSNVTEALFASIGTQPFTFSEISVNDPELFWNGFDNDVVGSVAVNAADISTIPMHIEGTTCGGSLELPVIAYGSTRLGGPTAIHSITVPSANVRWVQLSGSPFSALFACPLGSGPSGPCVQGRSGPGIVNLSASGTYQIVVGSLIQDCGSYVLDVGGSLGGISEIPL